MKHYFYFLLFAFFLVPRTIFAQTDATLTLSPKNPNPNEVVTVTISSYSFDVNTATITWTAGGKVLSSGVGKKSITLPLGDAGEEIPLKTEVLLSDGSSIVQQITISPQSVDLMYEATESYVPPFYKGRSLPAEGSGVRITALPTVAEQGKKVPNSNLSYSWYINDQLLPNASGLGKSTIRTSLSYLRESTTVRVLVRSPGGNVAEKEISISPRKIMPLLYKYDELLGTDLSQAFVKRLELSKDITLTLQPFYLSTKGLEATASYSWYVDGLPVTPQEKSILSLRPKENSSGVRNLTVTAEQSKRRLQKAETFLQVVFDTRN